MTSIDKLWRAKHCSEIGVDADYIILQRKFRADSDRPGWQTVGTAHSACLALFKADGVKAHAELIRWVKA